MVMVYVPVGVVCRDVLKFKCEVTDAVPGVTAGGVKEQVADDGSPEQPSETDAPKFPPKGLTVIV